jgi:hypothetical protein
MSRQRGDVQCERGVLHGRGTLADDMRLLVLAESAAKADSRVSTINLGRCALGPRTSDALGRALRYNAQLTEVTLEQCLNGGRALGLRGWASFFCGVALADQSSLAHLNLPRNRLGDGEVMALAACLRGDDAHDDQGGDLSGVHCSESDRAMNGMDDGHHGLLNAQSRDGNDNNIHLLRAAKGRLGQSTRDSGSAAVLRKLGIDLPAIIRAESGGVGGAVLTKERSLGDRSGKLVSVFPRGVPPGHNAPPLVVLNLAHNDIGNHGARVLADALLGRGGNGFAYGTSRDCALGSDKHHDRCRRLAGCPLTLLELVLDSNKVEDEGCQAIAEALEDNSHLAVLSLGANRIGPRGAKALAQALTENRRLEVLALFSNHVGAMGAACFAHALAGAAERASQERRGDYDTDSGCERSGGFHDDADSYRNGGDGSEGGGGLDIAHRQGRKTVGQQLERQAERSPPLPPEFSHGLEAEQLWRPPLQGASGKIYPRSRSRPKPVGGTRLQRLDLRDNGMGSVGYRLLKQALQRGHPSLVSLELQANGVNVCACCSCVAAKGAPDLSDYGHGSVGADAVAVAMDDSRAFQAPDADLELFTVAVLERERLRQARRDVRRQRMAALEGAIEGAVGEADARVNAAKAALARETGKGEIT